MMNIYLNNIKVYIYNFIVFLFTYGIFTRQENLSRISIIVFILWSVAFKESLKLREIFLEGHVKDTVKVICIYLSIYAASNLLIGNLSGIKDTWDLLRLFMTSGVFFVIIYKKDNFILPLVLGMLVAAICIVVPQFEKFVLHRQLDILHHNMYGGWVIAAIPFLGLYISRLKKIRFINYIRGISIVICLFTVFVLMLSPSRGGIIGFLVMIFSGVLFIKDNTLRKRLAVLIILSICVVCYIYFNRKYASVRGGDFERILFWRSSWQMFLDHPFCGVGTNNWMNLYMDKYCFAQFCELYPPMCHNIVLYLLSENGIIGTGAFLYLLIGCIRKCMHNVKECKFINCSSVMLMVVLGTLVHNMVDVIIFYKWFLYVSMFLWTLVLNDLCQNNLRYEGGGFKERYL